MPHQAGPWTPEATVEYPEAVRQLHREFLRAGSDVMQVGCTHLVLTAILIGQQGPQCIMELQSGCF